MSNKTKIRMFEIMQQEEYLKPEHLERIKNWLSAMASVSFLCVYHDKDLDTQPHYHIWVKMDGARTLDDISRQCEIAPQYIERVKSWRNALAYAFHRTENARNKYQYNDSAIVFSRGVNYDDIIRLSLEYDNGFSKEQANEVETLLYKYGECEISFQKVREKMTAPLFAKYYQLYLKMKNYRQLKVRSRNMQVIYITGDSGSGKTTLAKYLAMCTGYDYFVSGSGVDLLDGYDKEECIILDDLRGDAFKQNELFKLTDNNTNSTIKSRYQNKDISNCKLMIITSIKQPGKLYDWSNQDEPSKQFARRLENRFILVTNQGTIYEVPISENLSPEPFKRLESSINMDNVFAVMGIVKNNDKFETLFKQVGKYTMDRLQEQGAIKNEKNTNGQSK